MVVVKLVDKKSFIVYLNQYNNHPIKYNATMNMTLMCNLI